MTCREPGAFRGRRGGFTMIEMVFVMIIAGILAAIAVPGFSNAQRRRSAQNARDSFIWLANRARARAVEMGTTQLLEIDPGTDRAWVVRRNPTVAADTLETVDYPSEYQATVATAANTPITVCYNPRGYAWPCSSTNSPGADVVITFSHGGRDATLRLRPLGQVERLQ